MRCSGDGNIGSVCLPHIKQLLSETLKLPWPSSKGSNVCDEPSFMALITGLLRTTMAITVFYLTLGQVFLFFTSRLIIRFKSLTEL